MIALLMLGITSGLCWLFYMKGYKKAAGTVVEYGKKWAEEVIGEQTEEINQNVRAWIAGLSLPVRQDEIDLHDDIDDEIKSQLKEENSLKYYTDGLVEVVHEPTQLKELMQKGLDNVNKRYGHKKKD